MFVKWEKWLINLCIHLGIYKVKFDPVGTHKVILNQNWISFSDESERIVFMVVNALNTMRFYKVAYSDGSYQLYLWCQQ